MNSLIGASVPRSDALAKVMGTASYPADLISPHMLHLQVVFADRPFARIVSIDKSRALNYPGVIAVYTSADVPYNRIGLIIPDQPVLCEDLVRFEGDKVALVVAESKFAAMEGAKLVDVIYEDLQPVLDPITAMQPGAPILHNNYDKNILLHVPIRKGDIARAIAEADISLEGEFTTSWQEHAFLQPEAGIAYIDEYDRIVIETAGQWLHEDRRQIARMLSLPEDRIVVKYVNVGGAFGGREDLSIQHLLALATYKLKLPTAIVWTRHESITAHFKRHPTTIRCCWYAKNDGRITGVKAEIVADGGAYASTSTEVIKNATLFATGCYEIPNLLLDGYAVYTNNIPSGAFRGFGAPQVQFASEVMVTRLALRLNLDPIDVRRLNIYREDSLEPSRQRLPPGVSAAAVLEQCVEAARLHLRSNVFDGYTRSTPLYKRRGIGIACAMKNIGYSFGFPEQATATIELFGKAEIEQAVVRIGATDVGQGSHIILRQIAADTLGLPLHAIILISENSSETPDAGSASASRLTLMGGRAVRDAAIAAKTRWEATDETHLSVTMQFKAPATTALDPQTGAGKPNFCYAYAAQAVEVEVDVLTGHVTVLKVISVHDVGRIINRQQVEGQIEGGIAQALGYSLTENFLVDEGRIRTGDFTTYLLPTILDMPAEIIPIILENADPIGPSGARGIGEMSLIPFLPALSIAIHDALGVWMTQQPITPERVLSAINEIRELYNSL